MTPAAEYRCVCGFETTIYDTPLPPVAVMVHEDPTTDEVCERRLERRWAGSAPAIGGGGPGGSPARRSLG